MFTFFAPIILSFFEIRGINEKVETSQALLDIKEGEVKEIVVQDEKIFLTYENNTSKIATKEEGEKFAALHLEINIFQGFHIAEAFVDALYYQSVFAVRSHDDALFVFLHLSRLGIPRQLTKELLNNFVDI